MKSEKLKIILINHSFQVKYFYRRWEIFAEENPDIDVTLLAPAEYEWYKGKNYTYGENNNKILSGKIIDKENFHIKLFRIKTIKSLGWFSPDFKRIFKEIEPDIIYHIGTHSMISLVQCIYLGHKLKNPCKVLAFSMRGPALNLKFHKSSNPLKNFFRKILFKQYHQRILNYVNNNCDAIFCHYPEAVKCFREEGYYGPIFIQTQVGVNPEWFHIDKKAREEIRNKYNLKDSFVFGSATRFTEDKGVDIIIKALPKDGNWKYLLMGSGTDEQTSRIKNLIKECKLESKIIMTGFVDWYDINKYWNAIDCAIHVPLTTPRWEETFSLSIVQAMVIGKPVIGSNSGSVPYQIGENGMIVPEGNIDMLSSKILEILQNPVEASIIGDKMKARAEKNFIITKLNHKFKDTIINILNGKDCELNSPAIPSPQQ